MNKKYDKACNAFDKADRKCTKLKKSHDNDLEVIGNLWESLASESNACRDAEAKASSLEKNLQEQGEIISKLKTLDVARIEEIFSTCSTALKQFGVVPYDLPSELSTENFLSWIEGEFSGLEEIFTIAGDNFSMVYCEGFRRFLEAEEENLTDQLAGSGFSLSNFGDMLISSSARVETIKHRFLRDFWFVSHLVFSKT